MTNDLANEVLVLAFENIFDINRLVNANPDLGKVLNYSINSAAEELFGVDTSNEFKLPGIGSLSFPFYSFGNVTTVDLFNLSELALFRIYKALGSKYDYALDLGANVGLHSMIMSRSGFSNVIAVEADSQYKDFFELNMQSNSIENVELKNVAISNTRGTAIFTRLLGNTTGSHILGSKSEVYGDSNQIEVPTVPIADFIKPNHRVFIKMDIEGHEAVAIQALPSAIWDQIDVCLEIGSSASAEEIFAYAERNSLNLFCERIDWRIAKSAQEMPTNWRGGSVIATRNSNFLAEVESFSR